MFLMSNKGRGKVLRYLGPLITFDVDIHKSKQIDPKLQMSFELFSALVY